MRAPWSERADLPLVLALTLLVWAPTLWGGFLWDDHSQVLGARFEPSLPWLARLFEVDLWTALGTGARSGYYRPAFALSLGLDRWLWGLAPAGHHAQNLAWHLLAVTACWSLARQLGGRAAGGLAALLFALHPLATEVVAYVSARGDAMVAALAVGGMALLLPRPLSPLRAAAGGLMVLAALLTKEVAVPVLCSFPLWDRARWGRLGGWSRYLVLGLAGGLWLALRTRAALPPLPGGLDGLLGLASEVPGLLGLYGALLVVPHPLSSGRSLDYFAPPAWLVVAGCTALVVLGALLWRRAPRATLAAAFVAAGAWSASLVGMAATRQVGERYAYLPVLALAVAAGVAWRDRPRWGAVAAWAVAAVLLIQARLPAWRSELDLVSRDAVATPNPYAWHGYGAALCAAGQPDRAGPLLAAALYGAPPYLHACKDRVRCALWAGDRQDSLAAVDQARAVGCPAEPELADAAAVILALHGQWEGAVAAAEQARGAPGTSLWVPVLVAAAERRADPEAAVTLAAAWPGPPEALAAQVDALLAGLPSGDQEAR